MVDEYGDLAGLVTLEDLVEELVGDVRDEHDPGTALTRGPASTTAPGACDGLLRPDEASTLLGWTLPGSHEYDTLAGLLAEHLGRVPDEGDTVDRRPPPDPAPSSATSSIARATHHASRPPSAGASTRCVSPSSTYAPVGEDVPS